ncbi:MAG: hypothetical protein KGL39_41540 [Patescibacteria group bacterium]|nr:hypothetical protein [Patescibacteria group bacterium]
MATWHQQQAARRAFKSGNTIRYDHPQYWTVFCNPLHDMAWTMAFGTEVEAREYVANLAKHQGETMAKCCSILPPHP